MRALLCGSRHLEAEMVLTVEEVVVFCQCVSESANISKRIDTGRTATAVRSASGLGGVVAHCGLDKYVSVTSHRGNKSCCASEGLAV